MSYILHTASIHDYASRYTGPRYHALLLPLFSANGAQ